MGNVIKGKGVKDMFKIYVDGSYRDGIWGAGAVILDNEGNVIKELSTCGEDTSGIRNVAGETQAVLIALRWLWKNTPLSTDKDGVQKATVIIYHDYEGLHKWVNGSWNAKKPETIAYRKAVDKAKAYFNISFCKIKAHSGDEFNDRADTIAKMAVDYGTGKQEDVTKNVFCQSEETVNLSVSISIGQKELEEYGGVESFLAIIKNNTSIKNIQLA